MRFLPPRRWFQFRLSTWFVLVAILGWAMACRPWWVNEFDIDESSPRLVTGDITQGIYLVDKSHVNGQLLQPASALAVFLAWKAAWAVVERRRRRSAAA